MPRRALHCTCTNTTHRALPLLLPSFCLRKSTGQSAPNLIFAQNPATEAKALGFPDFFKIQQDLSEETWPNESEEEEEDEDAADDDAKAADDTKGNEDSMWWKGAEACGFVEH